MRMFESQELDCVFMETHMFPRKRQHMVLECIPLPRELGDMAPIYFKVCHHSDKVNFLSSKKDCWDSFELCVSCVPSESYHGV